MQSKFTVVNRIYCRNCGINIHQHAYIMNIEYKYQFYSYQIYK